MMLSCNDISMKKNEAGGDTVAVRRRTSSPAFLLAQIGSHAAARFAERLSVLGLIPAHAGILNILDATPSLTQQALASALRMVPSQLVGLLDDMEAKDLLERRNDPEDRRRYALHLTDNGSQVLKKIGEIAREHQRSLLSALSEEERSQLKALLERIAEDQELTPGVHPGYRALRAETSGQSS
jgi:DNA-binding MarR family transcriptional regulator